MTRIRQDKEGGLQSSVGLLDQSLGRACGQAKSKVAECPGVPVLQAVSFVGNHRPLSLGAGRKAPPSWGRGRMGERGCPPSSGGPARDAPKLLLTRQNPPLRRPLPRQIGSAVPLKGPESELRMKLTHGGRGGPWAGGVPGQQQQRKREGDRSCLCALLRRAETTKRHLNSTVHRDSCNEVTPHNGGIQDPRGPAGLGACPPGPADGDVIFR